MEDLINLNLYDAVFFDLETQKSADDVGGWENIPKMMMSVAVSFNIREGYMKWKEDEAGTLITHLKNFKHIISFNGDKFDFLVLSAYGKVEELYGLSFDLLKWVFERIGKRVSLEKLSQETMKLPVGKNGTGLEAIRLFNEGKIEELFEYCLNDVRLLHDIVMYARMYGYLSAYGKIIEIGYDGIPIND